MHFASSLVAQLFCTHLGMCLALQALAGDDRHPLSPATRDSPATSHPHFSRRRAADGPPGNTTRSAFFSGLARCRTPRRGYKEHLPSLCISRCPAALDSVQKTGLGEPAE